MYQVTLSQEAASFFELSDAKLQKRLDRAFAQLALSPYQHPNIKILKGQLTGYYRYRVGDYRIVYTIEVNIARVYVITIAHRSRIYRDNELLFRKV
jgi:mRNA interferase RelE/StbE